MRHQRLHRIAVHRDQLTQEADRQHLLGAVGLFFHDDLGQDRMGDVGPGLGVEHLEIDPFAGHRCQVVEGDVAGRAGVVEAPVGVFLDDYRLALAPLTLRHILLPRLCTDRCA